MSFYVDDEGNKKQIDKTTLGVLHDWVGFEIIKVACFAEHNKIPVQVACTLYDLMLKDAIDELFGGTEDEN